jgi:hypothetical protein
MEISDDYPVVLSFWLIFSTMFISIWFSRQKCTSSHWPSRFFKKINEGSKADRKSKHHFSSS